MLSRRFPHSISSAGGSFAPPDDIDDGDYESNDEDELMEDYECILGPACVMPGLHFPSECHTAEMMEEINNNDFPEEEA
jgi:hypothetical protein